MSINVGDLVEILNTYTFGDVLVDGKWVNLGPFIDFREKLYGTVVSVNEAAKPNCNIEDPWPDDFFEYVMITIGNGCKGTRVIRSRGHSLFKIKK